MHPHKIASLDKEWEQAWKKSATHEKDHLDPSTQGSISQFFSGGAHNPVIFQQWFDKLMLNFIVQGLHSLHTAERPEFVELLKQILPNKHSISRRKDAWKGCLKMSIHQWRKHLLRNYPHWPMYAPQQMLGQQTIRASLGWLSTG